MIDDVDLLSRYAAEQSEAAFAELSRRHVDLVYSTALRLVNGDVHAAQDVTQQVFTEVARQAKRLARHPALVAWLYTTARLMALRMNRTEQRRKAREQKANTMNELLHDDAPPSDWQQLGPVLEDAMHELDDKDRLAVLLRFFQNKTLQEVGVALHLTENAARMRVDRALDKLREKLARRGITAAAVALAAVISANAVQGAPPGLAATLSAAAIAGCAAPAPTIMAAAKTIGMTTLQKTVITATLATAIGAGIYQGHRTSHLRHQVQAFQRQQAQPQRQYPRDGAPQSRVPLPPENEAVKSPASDLLKPRARDQALARLPVPARPAANTLASPNTPAQGAISELPLDSWTNAGFATPQAALQTRGWAVVTGDREGFKRSVFITDDARKLIQDKLVEMASASADPGKVRYVQQAVADKWDAEEAILMPLEAMNRDKTFTGYRILSQQSPSADELILQVETLMASAPAEQEILKFRRFGNEWKVVIDADTVSSAR